MSVTIERKTCQAPDGVTIVYSAAGAGAVALVFIHGGLADRTFFDDQLRALGDRYRIVAPDLAGHGESGANRTKWGIPEFGRDVRAVIDGERLERVILFGNSLGGPVAIEAGLLLGERALGVVGIDTFQSFDHWLTLDEARQRAEMFTRDYAGSVRQMVAALFHHDADPALMADAERRMQGTPPEAAHAMFLSMVEYRPGEAAAKLRAPLRAINGDLFPTDVDGVRKVKPDFEVIIMEHTGHYRMLERPEAFKRHVASVAEELSAGGRGA